MNSDTLTVRQISIAGQQRHRDAPFPLVLACQQAASTLEGACRWVKSQRAELLSFDIPWHAGDVALLDNYAVMHGRRTFAGTRRILASLVAAHVE